MPTVKIYSIVTNDEYELPITELEGAKAVGDFLGLSENSIRQRLCRNSWGKKQKYKALESGIKKTDKKAYAREYGRKRIEREKLKLITEMKNEQ